MLRKIKTASNITVLIFLFSSCNDLGVGFFNNHPPPLSSDTALYVSVDGSEGGLWILNANSLQKVDSFFTAPGVPWNIEFSQDLSTFYSVWQIYPSRIHQLHSVNLQMMTVERSVNVEDGNDFLLSNHSQENLLVHGYKGLQVFNAATFAEINKDTTIRPFDIVALSPRQEKLYFPKEQGERLVGIGIYNLTTFKVEDVVSVLDTIKYPSLSQVDLLISPDERYAFLSAFSSQGLGGSNILFAVDLVEKRIVAEYPCGAYAQLAISPDGRFVYISDPAGYLLQMNPINKVLRYDVQGRAIETFLTPERLGITGTPFTTDKIIVASDNRTIFISTQGNIMSKDGKPYHILKVDAQTGSLLGSYTIPLNQGKTTNFIRNIRLGKYNR